ncbi:MAG: hypothetical protein ACPGVF_00040 [Flavobacteriaceae bacterium]
MKNWTAETLLAHYKEIIDHGGYIDSVHKIKLLTTIEMIEKTLAESTHSNTLT